MPKIDKASFETKSAYRKCVEAVGVLGATVQKVDQGQFNSTLILGKFVPTERHIYSLVDVRLTWQ